MNQIPFVILRYGSRRTRRKNEHKIRHTPQASRATEEEIVALGLAYEQGYPALYRATRQNVGQFKGLQGSAGDAVFEEKTKPPQVSQKEGRPFGRGQLFPEGEQGHSAIHRYGPW